MVVRFNPRLPSAWPDRSLRAACATIAWLLGSSALLVAQTSAAQPQPAPAEPPPAEPAPPATAPDAAPSPVEPTPEASAAPTPPSPSARPTAAPVTPRPDAAGATTPAAAMDEPPPPWLPPTRPPASPIPGPSPATPDDASPDDAVNPMLYAGLGTAALGAAGMVVFGVAQSRLEQLQNDPGYDAYRAGHSVDTDVCQAADQLVVVDGASSPTRIRRICNEAGTWETVSFVVLPTSLALLGVATYMIVAGSMDDDKESAFVRVVPSVGHGGGAIVVEGAF